MVSALDAFGPDGIECRRVGDACFGRALRRALPEDAFDRQPLTSAGGRYLIAADVRIDNRAEISGKLAISATNARRMSDGDLLLNAWERWQLECFEHLLGDIALAAWDTADRRLTLARSAASLKPLLYHQGADFTAFASMPQAIHALAAVPKKLNVDEAAAMFAGLGYLGSSTIFEGIRLVRQGHAVELARGTEKIIRHWRPERIAPASFKGDCGEALRAELDRAVSAQLRRHSGGVAAQLSAGRDSSAVATSAARALLGSGEQLIALTGAPLAGFSGPALRDRLADESDLAALTASAHPNISHFACRSERAAIGPELRRASSLHFGPMPSPSALNWLSRVSDQASAQGATVLLIGSTGNFSISAGGLPHLVDLWSRTGFGQWWAHARRIGGLSPSRWRTIGSVTFGPFMQQSLYRLLLRASGRDPREGFDVPILRQPYRKKSERILADFYGDPRPPRSFYDFRHQMLLKRESSEKMNEASWGLDVRDPTADRRLIELCLSFPPEALVSAESPRPAYESAFRERIPPEVLFSNKRGQQGADWFERFPKDEVAGLFRQYGQNRIVRELFDLEYVDQLIARWPDGVSGDGAALVSFQNELFGALGLADFIDLHFPN